MPSRARRCAAITATAMVATVTLALAATASTRDEGHEGDDGTAPTTGSSTCAGAAPTVLDEHAVLLANDGALPLSAHERPVVVVAPPTDTLVQVATVDVVLAELLGADVPRVAVDDLLTTDDVVPAPDERDPSTPAAPVAVVALEAEPPTTTAEPDPADGTDAPADVPAVVDTVVALDAAGWDVVVVGPRTEVLTDLTATAAPEGDTLVLDHVAAALALDDLPDRPDTEPPGDVEARTGTEDAPGTDRLAALLVGERAPAGRLVEPVPDPQPGDPTVPEPDVLLEAGHGLRYAAADLGDVTPEAVGQDGSVLRIDLVGTGTAPGVVPVHVDARDGDAWAELACTVVDLVPGSATSTTVTLAAATEPRELRVRTATDVRTVTVPAATDAAPDDAPAPSRAVSPSGVETEDPAAPDPEGTSGPATTDPGPAETGTEEPVAPRDEAVDATTRPTPDREPRADASIPLHARIPEGGTPSAGALRLTIGDGTVRLGAAERLTDRWHLTGTLPTVTVEDDRAHAAGWTVSVQGSALAATHGGTLGAERLGWAPTGPDRHGLVVGPEVASALAGGPGLAEPAVLATAHGAARHGPVDLGAHLDLETPLDTPPGDYAGTLTVTLFPVD